MESDIRNSVKESIMSYSSKFGLNDISYPSFTAQFGYRCKITAADYVLTLISAIDYCKDDGENRKCRFLEALRILNIQNVSHLEEQIKIVKSMMSDIAQNVGYFVELHYIICAGPFLFGAATECKTNVGIFQEKYPTLSVDFSQLSVRHHCQTDREKNQFISNPLILDIISNYALLTHSNLTKSKRAKELPFVLTIPIYDTEHSVIIGIPSLNSPTLLQFKCG
ncbi:hypothetical protein HZS_2819 [Henneguya salminicola]|nr:hypothetical protein HZS_2819 [Henneguya salminicola]